MPGADPVTLGFRIHGVGLRLTSRHAGFLEVAARRLRPFRSAGPPPEGLSVDVDGPGPGPPIRDRDPAGGGGGGREVYASTGCTIRYDPAADVLDVAMDGTGRATVDVGAGVARIQLAAGTAAALWRAAHPLLGSCLLELLKRRGRYPLHAAGLADGDRGILLAGPSGCGKSTTALLLARSGLRLLGDDLVLLRPHGPGGLRLLAFPDPVGLTTDALRLFPDLARPGGLPARPGSGKWQLDARAAGHRRPGPSCRPAVLLLPEVDLRGPTEIRPADPGEVLEALAPNVLLTDRASSQAHLDALARLARASTCARLRIGASPVGELTRLVAAL